MPVWAKYRRIDDRSPTLEQAHDWLVAHRPPPSADALIHGDLRIGNVIVGPAGLEAVIDWELVHVGDPLEDLAWLCLKAWRFGEPLEVGGLGTVDELVAAYEAAGGRPVDRDALHWWLVEKTLSWGIGCMLQADIHLSGRVRSVELAAVGRRVAEQEWDLIELLAPDACRAALAAPRPAPLPDDARPYGRPTARELLEAVHEFLTEQVMASDDRALAYHGRVAANALGIVERELAQPPRHARRRRLGRARAGGPRPARGREPEAPRSGYLIASGLSGVPTAFGELQHRRAQQELPHPVGRAVRGERFEVEHLPERHAHVADQHVVHREPRVVEPTRILLDRPVVDREGGDVALVQPGTALEGEARLVGHERHRRHVAEHLGPAGAHEQDVARSNFHALALDGGVEIVGTDALLGGEMIDAVERGDVEQHPRPTMPRPSRSIANRDTPRAVIGDAGTSL